MTVSPSSMTILPSGPRFGTSRSFGRHSVETRNEKPNARIDGIDVQNNTPTSTPIMPSMQTAAKPVRARRTGSAENQARSFAANVNPAPLGGGAGLRMGSLVMTDIVCARSVRSHAQRANRRIHLLLYARAQGGVAHLGGHLLAVVLGPLQKFDQRLLLRR